MLSPLLQSPPWVSTLRSVCGCVKCGNWQNRLEDTGSSEEAGLGGEGPEGREQAWGRRRCSQTELPSPEPGQG